MIENVDFTAVLTKSWWDPPLWDAGPIIISVPHDGMHNLGDFDGQIEVRPGRPHGIHGYDWFVWPIARDITQIVPATVVRGLCPRKYIDYNRPDPRTPFPGETQTAYVDPASQARRFYERYHGRIDHRIREILEFGDRDRCLLIDLHGFSKQPPYAPEGGYDLILGTANRRTIFYDDIDLRLGEYLSQCGYSVFVPKALGEAPHETRYSAGFTTRYYAQQYEINTVQIEIARRFRTNESQEIGQKLSCDIGFFLRQHYFFPDGWPS